MGCTEGRKAPVIPPAQEAETQSNPGANRSRLARVQASLVAARPHRRDRSAQHIERDPRRGYSRRCHWRLVVHSRHKAVHCGCDVLAHGVWSGLDGLLNTDWPFMSGHTFAGRFHDTQFGNCTCASPLQSEFGIKAEVSRQHIDAHHAQVRVCVIHTHQVTRVLKSR